MNSRHQRDQAARWMLLQQLFGIGTHRAHLLCERYGDAAEVFSLTRGRLEADAFFSPEERGRLLSPDFSQAEAEVLLAERFGAVLLTPDSPEYPESLRNIHSMPMVLYAVGDLSLLNGHYPIAMVGSRSPNEYGRAAAKKLAGEVAALGGVVVSGLAIGTDALCHTAALEANGKTIAFLAAGLDFDYPRTNRMLRKLIERFGLVLTEYPFGSPALGAHFPVRNRLIAGLSMATVVIQCRVHSGTMLTAGHALSQGRDLFAVPDSIFSAMDGANSLLAQGAEPALSGEQILLRYPEIYSYPLEAPNPPASSPAPPATQKAASASRREEAVPAPGQSATQKAASASRREEAVPAPPAYLSGEQAKVYAALAAGPQPVDLLCERCELAAGALLAILTQLELFGLVRLLPGRMVEIVRRS